jgi:hypothetical protein
MTHSASGLHLLDRRVVAWALCGALSLTGVVIAGTAGAADPAGAPPSGAALRLYRDPETGKIGGPPAGSLTEQAEKAAASAPQGTAEELSEEPVTAPAGGVKVNLRGRFQPAATRRGSQPGVVECTQPGAGAHE